MLNSLRDHPDIARCLRTGYPYPIKPVQPVDTSLTVSDEEFEKILLNRLKAEKGHKHES